MKSSKEMVEQGYREAREARIELLPHMRATRVNGSLVTDLQMMNYGIFWREMLETMEWERRAYPQVSMP
jgi:hypothetical protein